MKLVVLGATGGTGLEIVRQAIERGHAVAALVRAPDRLKAFHDRIALIQGDVLNVPNSSGCLEVTTLSYQVLVRGCQYPKLTPTF